MGILGPVIAWGGLLHGPRHMGVLNLCTMSIAGLFHDAYIVLRSLRLASAFPIGYIDVYALTFCTKRRACQHRFRAGNCIDDSQLTKVCLMFMSVHFRARATLLT